MIRAAPLTPAVAVGALAEAALLKLKAHEVGFGLMLAAATDSPISNRAPGGSRSTSMPSKMVWPRTVPPGLLTVLMRAAMGRIEKLTEACWPFESVARTVTGIAPPIEARLAKGLSRTTRSIGTAGLSSPVSASPRRASGVATFATMVPGNATRNALVLGVAGVRTSARPVSRTSMTVPDPPVTRTGISPPTNAPSSTLPLGTISKRNWGTKAVTELGGGLRRGSSRTGV